MAVERSTFSESWYRVADLKVSVHPAIQFQRQFFRGEKWYVLQDPSNNQFYRISYAAYQFLGMLDGNRTVGEIWELCSENNGDDAPTQNEVIQLLGQLYTSNLILGNLPADSEGLLRRYQKRLQREISGQLKSIMFVKIPLWDPDKFLNRWVGIFGKIFTVPGFVLWVILAIAGLMNLAGNWDKAADSSEGILNPGNLFLLYSCFAIVKAIHEFGHAFACKHFGLRNNSGGEVHTMGIMLMLLTPIPYVDASSSWAFRNKWQRIVVSSAGMIVELMVAAVAVIVWMRSSDGSIMHALAYNVMFVTSVTTILFNGNPLLRYDAYYILSDLIEMPNLQTRSNQYFLYICKRYLLGVNELLSPAASNRERFWLFGYAIASYIYRLFIFTTIFLFVADKLFIVGVVLAIGGIYRIAIKPLSEFLHYLNSSPELKKCRMRAMIFTGSATALFIVLVGFIKIPDWTIVEAVVEPVKIQRIHASTAGFLRENVNNGDAVKKGNILLSCDDIILENEYEKLSIRAIEIEHKRKYTQASDLVRSQVYAIEKETVKKMLADIKDKQAQLSIAAPFDGIWISTDIDKWKDSYIQAGRELGMIADDSQLIIRAVAKQNQSQLMGAYQFKDVDFRVKGRPDMHFSGSVISKFQIGTKKLPSAALGYSVGGEVETNLQDEDGTGTKENIFEIHINPNEEANRHLRPGQVLLVRFEMPKKSIAQIVWRRVLQIFQKRFHM
ncbi:MAG: PqqD family peptide modification chaperone [Lentisphaeria bacterium]|nr:PqqD family peptide modification chaperone [Lentisphaeria bacterium]NQZ68357.1 PqqD family peptide modification chaperone [Lentisphaeria bacterium]